MVRKLDIDGDARADLADHGGGASCHTDTFTRRPDGLTDVDAVVVRDGKNLKGRLLAAVLGTIGKGILEKAL
jgi:hypothetical protein